MSLVVDYGSESIELYDSVSGSEAVEGPSDSESDTDILVFVITILKHGKSSESSLPSSSYTSYELNSRGGVSD